MRRQIILFISLMLVMLVSIAGCGGSDNKVSDGAKPAVMDTQKSALFVDAQWLKDNLNNVILIDTRKDKEYNGGHIPGAVNAVWQSFAVMEGKPGDPGWGVLLPPEQLSNKIAALGIDGEKTVIVYAEPPGWGEDGRIVWMLKMAGIANAKILDGGIQAWKASNGELSKDVVTPTPASFSINTMDESLTTTTDWLVQNQASVKIVDSRSTKEYNGATDYGEARGGHLPAAITIPFENMFNKDGTLKSSEEVKALFDAAGLKSDDEIITYCTAGIRSAHMALIMRMVGFEKAKNYDASFYEWAGNQKLILEQ